MIEGNMPSACESPYAPRNSCTCDECIPCKQCGSIRTISKMELGPRGGVTHVEFACVHKPNFPELRWKKDICTFCGATMIKDEVVHMGKKRDNRWRAQRLNITDFRELPPLPETVQGKTVIFTCPNSCFTSDQAHDV